MIKKFTIATEMVDSSGDIILVSGVKTKDKTPLFVDFNESNIIGFLKIYKEDNKLMAEGDIPDILSGLYPAVGFNVIKYHMEGSIRVIDEMSLRCVSLSSNKNIDDSIQPVL